MITAVIGIVTIVSRGELVNQAYRQSLAQLTAAQTDFIEHHRLTMTEVDESNAQTIVLVGDIMLDRGVEAMIDKHGGGDFRYPFQYVAEELRQADFVFGNLEGPVSDRGSDVGGKYSFRFDPASIEGLKYAGFDLVSLANNHIWDWGRHALCHSPELLRENGIMSIGAGCDKTAANAAYVAHIGGTKIAWLAYTNLYPRSLNARDDRPGLSDFDLDKVEQIIKDLKQRNNVDLVMVSVHWGTEYKTRSNSHQQRMAQQMIDAGADVIVGHHPHVAQEVERYRHGWIFYSLGNFIFDQYFSEETMRGMIGLVTVEDGKIIDVSTKQHVMTETYQPVIQAN